MPEIVQQAGLPHDLPSRAEMTDAALRLTAGPKKPALERVFKPMGYSVRGGTASETGSFTLRRRTAANSTLELSLDVGTWSHNVTAIFLVWGLGFKGTLMLPPTAKAVQRRAVPHRRCRAVAEDRGEPGRAGRGVGTHFRSRDRSRRGPVAGVVPPGNLSVASSA